jgi:hypothetical protein
MYGIYVMNNSVGSRILHRDLSCGLAVYQKWQPQNRDIQCSSSGSKVVVDVLAVAAAVEVLAGCLKWNALILSYSREVRNRDMA